MTLHPASTLPVANCAGVPITACSRGAASARILEVASSELKAGFDVHLCNAYTLALADKNRAIRAMLCSSALNLPDGMSVVWAIRFLYRSAGLPHERVYGPDLFLDVFEQGQAIGLRHYLLGGAPHVLEDLHAELTHRFPQAKIVGFESPPFRELTAAEKHEQMHRITASGAQIVWLGLGTPKQDWVAADLAGRHPAVFVAVGAAFDFIAGTTRQAPTWMRSNGLEWVHRLATEPRRLWKRYLFGNARFVSTAIRHRMPDTGMVPSQDNPAAQVQAVDRSRTGTQ